MATSAQWASGPDGHGHLSVPGPPPEQEPAWNPGRWRKPRRDFRLIADLYLKGRFKLDELVSHTAGLDGLQGAFDALKAGAEARTVLLPNG
ncbi:MAG: hypothetical protein CM1200mP26_27990 [Acidimicrobiales bacterium]|nr:MAG: hypothetical protein CM1200mP26_27990 [Acidimicrobiales bacterium]